MNKVEMSSKPVTKKDLNQTMNAFEKKVDLKFDKFEEKFDQKIDRLASMINDGFVEAKKERESIRKEAKGERNKIQRQLDRFLVVEFDHAKGQIKDLQSRVDSIEKNLALR